MLRHPASNTRANFKDLAWEITTPHDANILHTGYTIASKFGSRGELRDLISTALKPIFIFYTLPVVVLPHCPPQSFQSTGPKQEHREEGIMRRRTGSRGIVLCIYTDSAASSRHRTVPVPADRPCSRLIKKRFEKIWKMAKLCCCTTPVEVVWFLFCQNPSLPVRGRICSCVVVPIWERPPPSATRP